MSDSDSSAFLPFLMNESLYLIPEKDQNQTVEEPIVDMVSEPVGEFEAAVPRKGVLVVTSIDIESNAPQKEFLDKILQAVGLGIDQVDLTGDIRDLSGYPKAICFGANHSAGKSPYTVLKEGSTDLITADEIGEISASNDLKRKLWTALQALFGIQK